MIIKCIKASIMCLIFLITHINLIIFNFINQYLISALIKSLLRNNIDCCDFCFKISVIKKESVK